MLEAVQVLFTEAPILVCRILKLCRNVITQALSLASERASIVLLPTNRDELLGKHPVHPPRVREDDVCHFHVFQYAIAELGAFFEVTVDERNAIDDAVVESQWLVTAEAAVNEGECKTEAIAGSGVGDRYRAWSERRARDEAEVGGRCALQSCQLVMNARETVLH